MWSSYRAQDKEESELDKFATKKCGRLARFTYLFHAELLVDGTLDEFLLIDDLLDDLIIHLATVPLEVLPAHAFLSVHELLYEAKLVKLGVHVVRHVDEDVKHHGDDNVE